MLIGATVHRRAGTTITHLIKTTATNPPMLWPLRPVPKWVIRNTTIMIRLSTAEELEEVRSAEGEEEIATRRIKEPALAIRIPEAIGGPTLRRATKTRESTTTIIVTAAVGGVSRYAAIEVTTESRGVIEGVLEEAPYPKNGESVGRDLGRVGLDLERVGRDLGMVGQDLGMVGLDLGRAVAVTIEVTVSGETGAAEIGFEADSRPDVEATTREVAARGFNSVTRVGESKASTGMNGTALSSTEKCGKMTDSTSSKA